MPAAAVGQSLYSTAGPAPAIVVTGVVVEVLVYLIKELVSDIYSPADLLGSSSKLGQSHCLGACQLSLVGRFFVFFLLRLETFGTESLALVPFEHSLPVAALAAEIDYAGMSAGVVHIIFSHCPVLVCLPPSGHRYEAAPQVLQRPRQAGLQNNGYAWRSTDDP